MRRVKYQDGIYADSVNGGAPLLLFRKAFVDGKICAVYVKEERVVASIEWIELCRQMNHLQKYMILDTKRK